MSRPRPSPNSRANSPHTDPSISVTRGLQGLRFGEPAAGTYFSPPPSYDSSIHHRPRTSPSRPDHPSTSYLEPSYDHSSSDTYSGIPHYPPFDPSLHYLVDPPPLETSPLPFDDNSLNRPDMSYQINPHMHGGFPDPRQYSEATSTPGYPVPSTGAPPSRSMSGPLPGHMLSSSIRPSSTYGEFRDVEREVGRQRRRNIAYSRHEKKTRQRRATALLPRIQDSGSSQATGVSGSIDFLVAQPHPSYSSTQPPYAPPTSVSVGYGQTPANPPYGPYRTGYVAPDPPTYHPGQINPSTYEPNPNIRRPGGTPVVLEEPKRPQCFEHGCNGRYFSTFSNLLRHQREKSGTSSKSVCHQCGAEFTRKTARDGHLAHDKCKGGRSSRK